MKILIGTDLILAYLNRSDYMEGIMILFRWLDRLKYQRYIDIGSVMVLTHFIKMNEFHRLKGFEIIKRASFKNVAIRIIENRINTIKANETKNMQAFLIPCNYLLNGDADFFITEDKNIHDIARGLGIDDKVYSIEDFLEKCVAEHRSLDDTKGIVLRNVKFGELSLTDPFFKTFINEYSPYYSEWFKKKALDDVYVAQDASGNIKALLKLKVEYKNEDYSNIIPAFRPAKRLKICSLKADYTGNKLGQRMMKIVFEEALRNDVDEIYVTVFNTSPQRKRLIGMIQGWGFSHVGVKDQKELVFARSMNKMLTDNPCTCYPYQDANAASFIVPLRKDYATMLLPTLECRSHIDDVEPYKSAIRKVLVVGEKQKGMNCGSVLLFFQKSDKKKENGVIAAGIVEKVYSNFSDEKEFYTRCRRRSFLSNELLSKYWSVYDKKPVVVEFLFTYSFNEDFIGEDKFNELGIKDLYKEQVYRLTNENFMKLIKGSNYEKNIVINKT